jgi:hypothetical protein
MDMQARNQYLKQVRGEYIRADKQEKGRLLDEAEKRTGLARKYLIRKLGAVELAPKVVRQRRPIYGSRVKTALARVWEIYDYPCGQRLAPVLRRQLTKLRALGELHCSDQVAEQLQQISPKTIDRMLAGERQRLQLNRYRNPSTQSLLQQQIPVKTSQEWDRQQLGNLQLDFVLHGGQSTAGHYAATLSVADIASGWWEGQTMLGRSRHATQEAFADIQQRLPFLVREIHPDNDRAFLNEVVLQFCRRRKIALSRSRPFKKNDNAWVEQRNWTHVRKVVGYRRYETEAERDLMNELYAPLALYKNFFQPTMKLAEKQRVGGKLHRRYEAAQTPYERVLASGQLSPAARRRLTKIYQSLNPAELKRQIEQTQNQLFELLEERSVKPRSMPTKKMRPRLVRSFMTQPSAAWLHS